MRMQVPTLRESLLGRDDWQQIADKQRSTVFGEQASAVSRARLEAFVQSLDLLDDAGLSGLDKLSAVSTTCCNAWFVQGEGDEGVFMFVPAYPCMSACVHAFQALLHTADSELLLRPEHMCMSARTEKHAASVSGEAIQEALQRMHVSA